MARPLRIEYPGAVYHVTSRGNARRGIFSDDEDREMFLSLLATVNQKYRWVCHSYCLMDNHYHLILETTAGNLSKGMRQLNGVYTMRFNRRHRSVGHILQGRYKAILIQKDDHLVAVCRYTILNPVRAKLVETPDESRWSSFRALVGLEIPHPCLTIGWILGQFGMERREAELHLARFMREGIGQLDIWNDVRRQTILGSDKFLSQVTSYVKGCEDVRELTKAQRYIAQPTLDEIFHNKIGHKLDRNRKIRDSVIRWGYSQREVGDYLGLHYSTISRLVKGDGS